MPAISEGYLRQAPERKRKFYNKYYNKFYFPLFWGMEMYDNEFETKENEI